MKKVLITGGTGYVGTLLVPQLVEEGYDVKVYDTMYFGCELQEGPGLELIQTDIRDTEAFKKACDDVDVVIHLACISNDTSFQLDENISKTINYDCFEPMVIVAKEMGVKRFIYASSSSVYGVSDAPDVKEDHPLVPLTLYNKFKGMCEPLLFKHKSEDFVCVTIRPATICGYSPRMRFDLSVNILTNHAVHANKITVLGGEQKRPNLHIQDMCDLYKLMLTAPSDKIQGEIFNVGFQNLKIKEIARVVKETVEEEFPENGSITIETKESNDLRSYHINSDKIYDILGFKPKKGIVNAVRDICKAIKRGEFSDSFASKEYVNVEVLKEKKVV